MKKVRTLLTLVTFLLGAVYFTQAQSRFGNVSLSLGLPISTEQNLGPGPGFSACGVYNSINGFSFGVELGVTLFPRTDGPEGAGLFWDAESIFNLSGYVLYDIGSLGSFDILVGSGVGIYRPSYLNIKRALGMSPRVRGLWMLTDEVGLSLEIPVTMIFEDGKTTTFTEFRIGALYRM